MHDKLKPVNVFDLFALPPETNTRFTFMVFVALIIATILSWGYIDTLKLNRLFNVADASNPGALWETIHHSSLTFNTGVKVTPEQLAQLDELRRTLILWRTECVQWLMFSLVLPIIILLLAYLVYIMHPRWVRRGKKLQKLSAVIDPVLCQELTELGRTTQIATLPAIEIETTSKTIGGQVFGYQKPYILRIGGGMRLLLRKNEDEFKAIMLHEFSHIANGDIERTYFTYAIWLVIIIFILAPEFLKETVFVVMGWAPNNGEWIRNILRIGASVIFIWFIGNSLVRTRELYSDWRVKIWGMGRQLEDIFGRHKEAVRSWWYSLSLRHTFPKERQAVLHNPDVLFRMKLDIPIIAGIMVGLSLNLLKRLSWIFMGIFQGTMQLWYQSELRATIAMYSGIPNENVALIFLYTISSLFLVRMYSLVSPFFPWL